MFIPFGKWQSVQSALIAHQMRPVGLAKWTLSKLATLRAPAAVGTVGRLGFVGLGVGERVMVGEGVAGEVAGVAGGVTAQPANHARETMTTRDSRRVSARGRWLGTG
ncbi:MAG: hypothetical protein WCF12_10385 [Propionicimonas sp.]